MQTLWVILQCITHVCTHTCTHTNTHTHTHIHVHTHTHTHAHLHTHTHTCTHTHTHTHKILKKKLGCMCMRRRQWSWIWRRNNFKCVHIINDMDSLTQAAQQVSDQLYGMGGSIQPSFTCSSCFCTPHTVSVLIRPSLLPWSMCLSSWGRGKDIW